MAVRLCFPLLYILRKSSVKCKLDIDNFGLLWYYVHKRKKPGSAVAAAAVFEVISCSCKNSRAADARRAFFD